MTTLHQANCVAVGGRGLLIEGPPGSGKSSLALSLIDRGAILVGDDGVTLEAREGRLWAAPPQGFEGVIEIRNVGLARVDSTRAAVALVIALDPAAPRYIEQPEQVERAGIALPLVRLWPGSPVLHLRAEHALAIHGLA